MPVPWMLEMARRMALPPDDPDNIDIPHRANYFRVGKYGPILGYEDKSFPEDKINRLRYETAWRPALFGRPFVDCPPLKNHDLNEIRSLIPMTTSSHTSASHAARSTSPQESI